MEKAAWPYSSRRELEKIIVDATAFGFINIVFDLAEVYVIELSNPAFNPQKLIDLCLQGRDVARDAMKRGLFAASRSQGFTQGKV